VARHADELAIVCRRDPQAPALRNDALCSKADFCQISFSNLGRNILANPVLKAGNFRFEFGGVALQPGDISSELGRRFPQSLRLAPDFPAGKPCDLLSERDCDIRHLCFPFCRCSGNTTTTISIIATPHDYTGAVSGSPGTSASKAGTSGMMSASSHVMIQPRAAAIIRFCGN
jgi:hypothetical protein